MKVKVNQEEIIKVGLNMQAESGLLSFAESSVNKAQSLFKCVGCFWLITATAISFAAEILNDDQEDQGHSQEVLALFNQCICDPDSAATEMVKAQAFALEDLRRINRYNHQALTFKPKHGVRLCRCFTTYWLFFKLIELEWQEILASEEINETYQFMDTVIAEGGELEAIEQQLMNHEELDDDSVIYLRNQWHQVRSFWYDLEQDLMLLSQGFMQYQPLWR